MKAYVDDMLVKSKSILWRIVVLEETFSTLRRHGMRLNLTKCAFKLLWRNFLALLYPIEE